MLIILAGLPGTGKTSIARELARRLGAVHVRVDSIEQAVRESGVVVVSLDDAGYRVGYAVADGKILSLAAFVTPLLFAFPPMSSSAPLGASERTVAERSPSTVSSLPPWRCRPRTASRGES